VDARAVDHAAAQLRELRHAEHEDLSLAALVLALAIAAAVVRPSLALPLFAGALVVTALGVRALLRRGDLVERLAGDRDAYVLPEVLAYAVSIATMERRQSMAAMIRTAGCPGIALEERIHATARELEALAAELTDGDLELDPACAVACLRLVSDVSSSPLLDPARPPRSWALVSAMFARASGHVDHAAERRTPET
jgi:hypothetical protein